MDMIYSNFRYYCPAMEQVLDIHYRMLPSRGLITTPNCEYYKDSPSCNRCQKFLQLRLQTILTNAQKALGNQTNTTK